MQCEFNIKNMKPNTVLVMNEKGIVECMDKDEFLKPVLNRCSQAEIKVEKLEAIVNKQTDEIKKYTQAIYDFISIQKGEVTDEKK